jgi:hypothetical protein
MNDPEKQENFCQISIQPNYSLLRLKIRGIPTPEFNFVVESECSTDDITQKKMAKFKERAERAE